MDYSLFINKHKYKIAFSVFLAYLCLSFYKIANNSLWYDECFSIDWANDPLKDVIDYSLLNDTNPPLYLIILHYWMNWFGDSEMALRSLSAISVSLASGIFFLFCNRFFNWQTAIFSILLFFASNELYYYSQEGRTYGLVILFCVLSNYAFMSLIKKPNWKNAILLGVFNIIIFYLHTLASFCFIAQIILIPFLTFDKQLLSKKDKSTMSFLGYQLKHIVYYIISWLTFVLLFWPWKDRFFQVLAEKGKGFWLEKPTFDDFKRTVFEFYNSKELFFVYLISFLVVLSLLLFVKKLRDNSFNYKLIIIPIILGPFLLYLNYVLAANIVPIFLKRYVLFTILGFILTYAYIFSLLKVDFRIKLGLFSILFFFTIYKMKVPKESYWDFREGVEILKKAESPTCYISTDVPMLYAYYRDRKVAFKAQVGIWRDDILNKYGVFTSYGTDWPDKVDFSKYKDIYFARSFDNYNDPNRIVEKTLNQKFLYVEDLSVKGMNISHYVNQNITSNELQTIKENIKNNKEWYAQVLKKAKEKNITVDSMITLDALWYYKSTSSYLKN